MNQTDLEKEVAALKKELAKVQADFGKLAEDGGRAAKQATEAAHEAVAAATKKLEEEAQKVYAGLQGAGRSAVKTGENAVTGVQEQIQDKPLASAAAALGLGFVLGMLVSRRR
jgi:ElaB/YqjD/DUF883 family membrane-anchored ribosome-binding protein